MERTLPGWNIGPFSEAGWGASETNANPNNQTSLGSKFSTTSTRSRSRNATKKANNHVGWASTSHAAQQWDAEKETQALLAVDPEDETSLGTLPGILDPRNKSGLFVKPTPGFGVGGTGGVTKLESQAKTSSTDEPKEIPKADVVEVKEEPEKTDATEEPEQVEAKDEPKEAKEDAGKTEEDVPSPKRIRVRKRVKKTPKQSETDLRYMEFKKGMKGPLMSVLPNELTADEAQIDDMLAKLYLAVPAWMKCPTPIMAPQTGFFPMLMNEKQMRKFQELFDDE